MADGVAIIREVLSGDTIHLHQSEDYAGIFDKVDAFINLSRGNETVEQVVLCPFTDPGEDASSGTHRYAIWDKIAEGIGNLQALREITISDDNLMDAEMDVLVPDWEILACILRRLRLRRGIQLCMQDYGRRLWGAETLPAFTGVIHGQAMIKGFSTGNAFPFDCLDILCSTLLTLPDLENVAFDHIAGQGPEEGQSLESMVKLLQLPTLRKVGFGNTVFTNTLSKAVAKALKERSDITDLHIIRCFFPDGGDAVIAGLLKTNTTLKNLYFFYAADKVFHEALAAALLCNSTLQKLTLRSSGNSLWLSPLFLALQVAQEA